MRTAREWARDARAKGYHAQAKAWEAVADEEERNRPKDGKSLAAGEQC
jgi:hypothetical protein